MEIIMDCRKCGTRFDWDTKDEKRICARCKTMEGTDIKAILIELRKIKVPGQENILRLIEVLNDKLEFTQLAVDGMGRQLVEEVMPMVLEKEAKDGIPGSKVSGSAEESSLASEDVN